jgi:hypothetical protein
MAGIGARDKCNGLKSRAERPLAGLVLARSAE